MFNIYIISIKFSRSAVILISAVSLIDLLLGFLKIIVLGQKICHKTDRCADRQ